MSRRKTTVWILSGSIALLNTGCDERVAEVAREAADRQAEQNRTMAELQQEVAAGSRRLVEADAEARRELLSAERDLHSERSSLNKGRDDLEHERKSIAAERRTDSLLVPALQTVGAVALAVVVVGFSWYTLVRLRAEEGGDAELVEFLVQELADKRLSEMPGSPAALLPQSRSGNHLSHDAFPGSKSTETS